MTGVISRNLKAVEALLGMSITLLLALSSALPASWTSYAAVAVGALTVFKVWLAKNEELIKQAEAAVGELVDGTTDALHKQG